MLNGKPCMLADGQVIGICRVSQEMACLRKMVGDKVSALIKSLACDRFASRLIMFMYVCFSFLAMSSCSGGDNKDEEKIVTPWGEVSTGGTEPEGRFTVGDIVSGGELIALTMTGPDTYYDYHGRGMGTQYLLCERFARRLGVSLRVELCRDTAEMLSRLSAGDGDIIAFQLPKKQLKSSDGLIYCGAGVDSLGTQWAVANGNHELADSLDAWFTPPLFAEVAAEQRLAFASGAVRRHVYAPFLDRGRGVISSYDHLFKKYAPTARWDWRLMAAQCYQESCFDPRARSWAGACGLMQIMPATADQLGLSRSAIYDPEQNIHAAARYIARLSKLFADVPGTEERRLFVLAAYNGGYHHIRDAMALARKHGKSPHRWREVAPYVLGLETPAFYNDPVVSHGYMRGSETVGYVDRIRQRYAQYRGVPYSGNTVTIPSGQAPVDPGSPFTPKRAKRKHRFHI